MAPVSEDFYRQLLRSVDAPASDANLFALHAWQTMEGGRARFNPFNTTMPATGASDYNSVGVKNYPDQATGLAATVHTLKLHYYDEIRTALKAGDSPNRVGAAIDASPWGTHGVAAYVRAMWRRPASFAYPGRPVREGDRDNAVLEVQRAVDVDPDGIFGPHTRAAVVAFQRLHHLEPDGIVGPLTWHALFGN